MQTDKIKGIGSITGALVLFLGFAGFIYLTQSKITTLPGLPDNPLNPNVNISQFKSAEEFKAYIEAGKNSVSRGIFYGTSFSTATRSETTAPSVGLDQSNSAKEAPTTPGTAAIGRVSETNVQVLGIDEPDVVKTDGKNIYFSQETSYVYTNTRSEELKPFPPPITDQFRVPSQPTAATNIFKAFPPAELKKIGSINSTGNLFLSGNVLVIITSTAIVGYDVSNVQSPKEIWKNEINSNSEVIASRLRENLMYLVTKTGVDSYQPCPVEPLNIGGKAFPITCMNIYHPESAISVDSIYSVMITDPKTGTVKNSTSFVGSSGTSVVYLSGNAAYVTYQTYGDIFTMFYNFVSGSAADLLPAQTIEKLSKLASYDISQNAKFTEFETVLESHLNSLNDNDRLQFETELTNRANDYFTKHGREMEKTGIVRINLRSLLVEQNGEIPGRLLNQFSLDENGNYLRAAVTIDSTYTGKNTNDIYVLDRNLNIAGSITDLGIDETIQSVRFVEDRGYVVTFRQTDPFFVLDLTNPKKPELKGELKIPGFSAYLHPIDKNTIVGIGRDGNGQVKASLFDVTDPQNPTETSKYVLKDYTSDILNTHHAFLLDKDHQCFFVPGDQGGYVISYANKNLSLKKAVANISATRALYINDYLYIIGNNEINIINEKDWTDVNHLTF